MSIACWWYFIFLSVASSSSYRESKHTITPLDTVAYCIRLWFCNRSDVPTATLCIVHCTLCKGTNSDLGTQRHGYSWVANKPTGQPEFVSAFISEVLWGSSRVSEWNLCGNRMNYFAIPLWKQVPNGIHFLVKVADLDKNYVSCTVYSV